MDEEFLFGLKVTGLVGLAVTTMLALTNLASYDITKSDLNKYGREKIATYKKLLKEEYRKVFPFKYVYLVGYELGERIAFKQYDKKHECKSQIIIN